VRRLLRGREGGDNHGADDRGRGGSAERGRGAELGGRGAPAALPRRLTGHVSLPRARSRAPGLGKGRRVLSSRRTVAGLRLLHRARGWGRAERSASHTPARPRGQRVCGKEQQQARDEDKRQHRRLEPARTGPSDQEGFRRGSAGEAHKPTRRKAQARCSWLSSTPSWAMEGTFLGSA
jgi:hypothetical protein